MKRRHFFGYYGISPWNLQQGAMLHWNPLHPDEEIIYNDLIDLVTNETRLVLSIAEIFEQSVRDFPVIAGRHMWFNHTDINPSGTRFLFLARTRGADNRMDSAMFTANMDGSEARMVVPFGTDVSHFGWRNDEEIVATFRWPEQNRLIHWLFHDGHCTFSADGRWMCTDRKQDESRSQSLWLFDIKTDKGMMLANLPVNEWRYLHSDTRCDFHPRWNPSGNKICFDAVDTATHTRQMHLIEFQDM